jgi:hypothetical protein
MTLANMRENGVRSLCVTCEVGHHEAVMNVDAFGEAVPVSAFGPRLVCTVCGIMGAFARPNCRTIAAREPDRRAVGDEQRGRGRQLRRPLMGQPRYISVNPVDRGKLIRQRGPAQKRTCVS